MAKDAMDGIYSEFGGDKLEKNKEYAKERYKDAMKPVKKAVKKIAREFDIETKD